jgi:low affinity Fe/Cu permease
MEMTFRDDACRIRTDSAPENFVTLKHMAANLGRKSRRRKKGKVSLGRARKAAAWDDDDLVKLISA